MPHGRSWKLHKPREFEIKVIPSYFDHSKFSSFIRQANGWGFKRMTTKGVDRNSHYHERFLRGTPHLIKTMKRPVSGTTTSINPTIPPQGHEHYPTKGNSGSSNSRDLDPDFYRISEESPLPEFAPKKMIHPLDESHFLVINGKNNDSNNQNNNKNNNNNNSDSKNNTVLFRSPMGRQRDQYSSSSSSSSSNNNNSAVVPLIPSTTTTTTTTNSVVSKQPSKILPMILPSSSSSSSSSTRGRQDKDTNTSSHHDSSLSSSSQKQKDTRSSLPQQQQGQSLLLPRVAEPQRMDQIPNSLVPSSMAPSTTPRLEVVPTVICPIRPESMEVVDPLAILIRDGTISENDTLIEDYMIQSLLNDPTVPPPSSLRMTRFSSLSTTTTTICSSSTMTTTVSPMEDKLILQLPFENIDEGTLEDILDDSPHKRRFPKEVLSHDFY